MAVLAAVMVAGLLPASAGGWRLLPVAAVLVVLGARTVDPVAVAVVAGLAYLLVVGFLVNHYGVLTWHVMADTYRLMTIFVPAGAGLAIGAVRHRLRRRRRFVFPRVGRRAGVPVGVDGDEQGGSSQWLTWCTSW